MIKISPTPTRTIITEAYTNSEWDTVEVCIIQLPDSAVVDAALAMLTHDLPEVLDDILSSLTLTYWNFDFFCYSDSGKADHIYNALEDKDFVFVEFDNGLYSFEGLQSTEQDIRATNMTVSKYGTILFKGWAKHTDEEYWTEGVSINKIYNN